MSTREYYKGLTRVGSGKRSVQIPRSATNEVTQVQDTTNTRNGPRKTPTDSFTYYIRPAASGSKHDPFTSAPIPSTSLNPHLPKRKKSSQSTSMHTDDNFPIIANEVPSLRDSGTSYYSLPSSHQSFTDLHRSHHSAEGVEHPQPESDAPISGSRRDRDKGKAVDRPHTSNSRRERDAFTDDTRRTKHQERADKHVYSGPLAHAEFERMKKEIENLKKVAQDHKKTAKKHIKKIEDLKSQLSSETQAKQKHEAQVQTLKTKYDKHEELISTIETSLQCQICMDLLHRPFALAPCGHILCLPCLQQWFRQAPPSADDMDIDLAADPHYILTRAKSCPCCRAVVRRRPVPVFLVKAVVGAVATARAGNIPHSPGGNKDSGASSLDEEDPWKGIFASDEDEEDFGSSDDYDEDEDDEDEEDEDSDDSDMDNVLWTLNDVAMTGPPFRLESEESSSGSGSEDDDEEEEGGGEDDSVDGDPNSEHPMYVPARWEPPTIAIDADETDSDVEFSNTNARLLLSMQRRGCPLLMIQNFEMTYSHRRGLIAFLPSLDERDLPAPQDPTRREAQNRVFLGWNIRVDEEDGEGGGREFMSEVLKEVKAHPRRWKVEGRIGYRAAFDVKRLVRAADVEEWDTTDTEVWVGGQDADEDADAVGDDGE